MDSESINTPESTHLETLRNQARAAILSRRKADARGALGKLVVMSGETSDRENLDELIRGVGLEVERYIHESAPIQKRLQDGATLEQIQDEINLRIPHWRAFANDLPDLRIARDGLAAHEDPRLKERLKGLERKLADGSISVAIAEWEEMGEPASAADGVMVQMLEKLGELVRYVDQKNWQSVDKTISGLRVVVTSELAPDYARGLTAFIEKSERVSRYEKLLNSVKSIDLKKKSGRNELLEELMKAKGEVETLMVSDPSLDSVNERMDDAIERISSSGASGGGVSSAGRIPSPVILTLVAAVGGLCAFWYFNRVEPVSGNSELEQLEPLPPSVNASGGKPSEGDEKLLMPNGYRMLFRKIYLAKDPGVGRIEMEEYDQTNSVLHAPFVDDSGRRYFLMGKTEVSVGQYSQFMKPEKSLVSDPSAPLRQVTVEDAEKFCKEYSVWLTSNASLPKSVSEKFGQARLPTSGEWEFTARGGNPQDAAWNDRYGAYPTGDISAYEWFSGPDSSQGKVRRVNLLEPNRLGIADMLGNVREMTLDESSGRKEFRMRGGDFSVSESSLTPALKAVIPAMMPSIGIPFRQDGLGFRILLSVPPDWNEK